MTCAFPHCRQEGSLIYLGRDVCVKHWQELCQCEPEAEAALLTAIKLIRTAQGEVIELNGAAACV